MTGLVVQRNLDNTAGAVLSEDGRYRYFLSRQWDKATPPVVWIMLNPSTADALTDDPTIRRCTGFARLWGWGGIEVINLYGLRCTDPAELRDDLDPVGPDNNLSLAHVMDSESVRDGGPVICGWGAHPAAPHRAMLTLRRLRARGIPARALGFTAGGQPRHPLYLPKTATPVLIP